MLRGTASPAELGRTAPGVTIEPGKTIALGNVKWVQFTYEVSGDKQALLPPNLAPTTPSIVTLQIWRASGGELGDFGLAQARVSCRAGVRIRTFLLQSVIDGAAAATTLENNFGYFGTPGRVVLHERSDKTTVEVISNDRCVAAGEISSLRFLEPSALQHIENMHLVDTKEGLRLMQVEPSIVTNSLLRGPGKLTIFENSFWRLPGRELRKSVIGATANTEIVLSPVRYVQEISEKAS